MNTEEQQLIMSFDNIINNIFDKNGDINHKSLERLRTFFKGLGDIYRREFEINLTKIVEYYLEEKNDIIERLKKLLYDEKIKNLLDEESRFALLFLIFTYHRRMKNIGQMEELIRDFREDFQSNPLFKHLEIMFLKYSGNKYNLIQALELSYSLIQDERVSQHTGVLHNFAETVVEALERGLNVDDKYIRKAEEVLQKIIYSSPKYPKYHATYARYLAFYKKDYDRAKSEIKRAIDLEDSKKKDYALRINDYVRYLMKIEFQEQLEKSIDKINKKIDEGIKSGLSKFSNILSMELEAERTRYIEMLGLFATLISIALVGVFSVMASPKPSLVMTITLSLAGILLAVLSGFHIMIYKTDKAKKAMISCFLGFSLIILAVILQVVLWK